MVKTITEQEFNEVLGSEIAVVDFFATWCGPCKMLGPVLEQLSEEYTGKINFFKIDVDEAEETAAKYGIQSIPAVFAFKNGELKDKQVGYNGKEGVKAFLDSLV